MSDMTSETTHAEHIRCLLHFNHDGRWGLRFYRCTYASENDWKQFVQRMKSHALAELGYDEHGAAIQTLLDLDFIDDRAKWNGASMAFVRADHVAWAASVNGSADTRYTCCVYVDAEVIRSVLTGTKPGSQLLQDVGSSTAYIKLVNANFEEEIEPAEEGDFDSDDEESLRMYNEGDEGYPPVEGSKRHDVGWMKVAAQKLIPIAYDWLGKSRWMTFYVRPPAVLSR